MKSSHSDASTTGTRRLKEKQAKLRTSSEPTHGLPENGFLTLYIYFNENHKLRKGYDRPSSAVSTWTEYLRARGQLIYHCNLCEVVLKPLQIILNPIRTTTPTGLSQQRIKRWVNMLPLFQGQPWSVFWCSHLGYRSLKPIDEVCPTWRGNVENHVHSPLC